MKIVYKILWVVLQLTGVVIGTLIIQAIIPRITSSEVTVYDTHFQSIKETKVIVTYHAGCASSPCHSEIIFDGYSDKNGRITLSNFHLRNLNTCIVGDVVYDCYDFEIHGYSKDYFHIERDGKAFYMYFQKMNE